MTRLARPGRFSPCTVLSGVMFAATAFLANAQGFRVPEDLALPELLPETIVGGKPSSADSAAAEFKDARHRETFLAAVAAFRDGRTSQAMGMVRPLAERGHHEAEFLMGQFLESLPAPTSAQYREAAIWYLRGAHAGLPQAMNNLAALHVDGRGVPATYSIARHWYQKASEAGYAIAQYNFALMHGRGQGVPRNDALMLQWLRRAATAGLARAQSQLGRLLVDGNTSGAAEGVEWLRKAALQSDVQGQFHYATALQKGVGTTPDPAAALEWFARAADQGHAGAQWALGRAHESGTGTAAHPEKALAYYEAAARQNQPEALQRVIAAYRNGELGATRDSAKADFWSLRLRLASRGASSATAASAPPVK